MSHIVGIDLEQEIVSASLVGVELSEVHTTLRVHFFAIVRSHGVTSRCLCAVQAVNRVGQACQCGRHHGACHPTLSRVISLRTKVLHETRIVWRKLHLCWEWRSLFAGRIFVPITHATWRVAEFVAKLHGRALDALRVKIDVQLQARLAWLATQVVAE